MQPHQTRKLVIAAAVVLVLLLAAAITLFASHNRIQTFARDRVEKTLQTHFQSQVQFTGFEISLFPHVSATITGLEMRFHGRTDIPPLIRVRKVSVYAHLLGLIRPKPEIAFVQLDGLQIHTPPREPGGQPMIHGTDEDLAKKYPAVVEELHADDAIIVVLRAQNDKPPREFPIHHLELHNLSFDRPADFHATLTNPVPAGEIESTGKFGPWLANEPSETPAVGQYTFDHADLGTLKGIEGILSSKGKFDGPLDYLTVEGETDVPDFRLRTGGRALALHTDFSALVDGTNGNTYLNSVIAQFLHTTLDVKGEIVDENREVKGRTIVLYATSEKGRVEDLLRLAVNSDRPVMTGAATLTAKIDIPEGTADLLDRLKLDGQVGVVNQKFSSQAVQEKVDTLSRKGQGKPNDTGIDDAESDLIGNFHVEKGIVTFSNLSFHVTGATIHLNGTYNIESGQLDFYGHLLLQAKLSQTTTGVKSFFLKAVDPFFKGQKAGTDLPIKITGTKDHPSFGLDLGGKDKKNEPAASTEIPKEDPQQK
jgi:hypothetical protein